MNYFDVTFGNIETKKSWIVQEFSIYNKLVSDLKDWASRDSQRYAMIKFSNKLTDAIKWKDGKVVVIHFNDVESIAKSIREKK